MRAATYRKYGGPEVLKIEEIARPEPGPGQVRVRVEASSVTTADWRLRAAAFPSFTWLPGRLMFGLRRPRKPVLGGDFAGRIDAVGDGVTEFQPGDPVYGFSGIGAHAEYLVMDAGAAIVPRPASLSAREAAALPFGALAALVFLRDFAKLKPGERVLILGATGGVGAYAVQIARALGARVDGVTSAANAALARDLGAQTVLDYRTEDFADSGQTWDVILDPVGVSTPSEARKALASDGRFVALNMDWATLFAALTNRFRRGPKVVIGVNGDRREDLDALTEMIAEGSLRPVIDEVFQLSQITEAHAKVESRHRAGAVVLDMTGQAEAPSRS
ncbi:NADPH:quinone reductase-like Zn-dependent oxidoreductase [Aliiruegeria haliotis]|uniref:NADPH:quinone reductase-like Zn-dependent oxidoreductase n=1 Tax=Aliiruegeria haliotis TaxID=1280846 RepID=A0A2T0RYM9_9RHOB|nr:NAD(P)-dependent alcohol dehydrogenase [Aliiruegeria haliotis]PRY26289.1 NADPH:quinone reductase-like Zn-dependent oxidoreductase [Aliiruegeria haliotis]